MCSRCRRRLRCYCLGSVLSFLRPPQARVDVDPYRQSHTCGREWDAERPLANISWYQIPGSMQLGHPGQRDARTEPLRNGCRSGLWRLSVSCLSASARTAPTEVVVGRKEQGCVEGELGKMMLRLDSARARVHTTNPPPTRIVEGIFGANASRARYATSTGQIEPSASMWPDSSLNGPDMSAPSVRSVREWQFSAAAAACYSSRTLLAFICFRSYQISRRPTVIIVRCVLRRPPLPPSRACGVIPT